MIPIASSQGMHDDPNVTGYSCHSPLHSTLGSMSHKFTKIRYAPTKCLAPVMKRQLLMAVQVLCHNRSAPVMTGHDLLIQDIFSWK